MAAWLLVLTALDRRFRRQAAARLPAGLAAAAVALRLAIPGLLHAVAVTGSAVNNHKSYDVRLAWLLGICECAPQQPHQTLRALGADMSASSTALLVAFLALLHPAKPQTLLIVLNSTYLGLLLVGLRRPGRPPFRVAVDPHAEGSAGQDAVRRPRDSAERARGTLGQAGEVPAGAAEGADG